MVDRNLLREYYVPDEEVEKTLKEQLPDIDVESGELDVLYDERTSPYEKNQIVEGTVVRVDGEEVVVDIGYKSEGSIPIDEWSEHEEPPKPGDKVQVLLEEVEDDFGLIILSKRKADRIREWERIIATHKEGDVVKGTVVRKIKGGLLVNIGVNVFLPASQVDIRRPHDIGEWVGKEIKCVILKIDEGRRNIVVSRRKLIEDRREEMKKKLLAELEPGQLRKGIVKNIADFGAFVDLGGIDGLLHITDMSWGRISHPSDMVKVNEEIEVVILNVDRENEKVQLGLKQKTPSPWENIEEKYPVGSKVKGVVVNVKPYGAFVKLEDGVEGLVHISEMSWTRRINDPSELVKIGDEVEVVVLGINKQKQEISLGMKQAQPNPWDTIEERCPVGSVVEGTVRNIVPYGAFVEIEEGIDGLLHISDMSWTRKITHASEMVRKGQKVKCRVLNIDKKRRRISLGMKQLRDDPWEEEIPNKYRPGSIVKGKVTKLTNFGVFVELEPELEGLLHISELSDKKVSSPEKVVKVGDIIDVRILRVDTVERKIGLSRRLNLEEQKQAEREAQREAERRAALRGGTDSGSGGPLFSLEPAAEPKATERQVSSQEEAGATQSTQAAAGDQAEPAATEQSAQSKPAEQAHGESTEAASETAEPGTSDAATATKSDQAEKAEQTEQPAETSAEQAEPSEPAASESEASGGSNEPQATADQPETSESPPAQAQPREGDSAGQADQSGPAEQEDSAN